METISSIQITNFVTESGKTISLELSYQTFGMELNKAPIVLVNHALTGNSNVCGIDGWWNQLIGEGRCIDTLNYSILAFNVPGNGYSEDSDYLITDYKSFNANDIARIFVIGLEKLRIDSLFAVIGGSVGGGLAWELAVQRPDLIKHLIPIAADWKSTDWLIANCFIQDNILNHSKYPLSDARMHAMTLYRTPESFSSKFTRSKKEGDKFNVESWLSYHGKALNDRFQLSAYKMMNQILKTIDISNGQNNFLELVKKINSSIHIVTIDSDLFFKARENRSAFTELRKFKSNVFFHEIKSIHGHDAFLIEYEQLEKILKPVFNLPEQKQQRKAS